MLACMHVCMHECMHAQYVCMYVPYFGCMYGIHMCVSMHCVYVSAVYMYVPCICMYVCVSYICNTHTCIHTAQGGWLILACLFTCCVSTPLPATGGPRLRATSTLFFANPPQRYSLPKPQVASASQRVKGGSRVTARRGRCARATVTRHVARAALVRVLVAQ